MCGYICCLVILLVISIVFGWRSQQVRGALNGEQVVLPWFAGDGVYAVVLWLWVDVAVI